MHDYQFVIEESPTEFFDEVGCWLKMHGFLKYADTIKARGVLQLRDITKLFKRVDFKKVRIS